MTARPPKFVRIILILFSSASLEKIQARIFSNPENVSIMANPAKVGDAKLWI